MNTTRDKQIKTEVPNEKISLIFSLSLHQMIMVRLTGLGKRRKTDNMPGWT